MIYYTHELQPTLYLVQLNKDSWTLTDFVKPAIFDPPVSLEKAIEKLTPENGWTKNEKPKQKFIDWKHPDEKLNLPILLEEPGILVWFNRTTKEVCMQFTNPIGEIMYSREIRIKDEPALLEAILLWTNAELYKATPDNFKQLF